MVLLKVSGALIVICLATVPIACKSWKILQAPN
jgi:hypothetical protein